MPHGRPDPKDGITVNTADIEQTLKGVDILERQRLMDQLPNYNDRLFFTKFFRTYITLPDICGQVLMDCVPEFAESTGATGTNRQERESEIEYDSEANDFLKYEREMELEMILREKVEKILKSNVLRPANKLQSSNSVEGSICSLKPKRKDIVEYDYESTSFLQKLWRKLGKRISDLH